MRVIFVRKDNHCHRTGWIFLKEDEIETIKEALSKDECEYLMYEDSECKYENEREVLKALGVNRPFPRKGIGCPIED